jgi:hypothetical protein
VSPLLHRLAALAGSLVLASSIPAAPVLAASGLSADLEGKAIAIESVGSYYCHDLDYPRIHCFTSSAAVEASIARLHTAQPDGLESVSSTPYIRLYDGASFTGVYIALSVNYSNLGTIGWNDRASSYIGLNGLSWGLWTDAGMTGSGLLGCCNHVSSTEQR